MYKERGIKRDIVNCLTKKSTLNERQKCRNSTKQGEHSSIGLRRRDIGLSFEVSRHSDRYRGVAHWAAHLSPGQ